MEAARDGDERGTLCLELVRSTDRRSFAPLLKVEDQLVLAGHFSEQPTYLLQSYMMSDGHSALKNDEVKPWHNKVVTGVGNLLGPLAS